MSPGDAGGSIDQALDRLRPFAATRGTTAERLLVDAAEAYAAALERTEAWAAERDGASPYDLIAEGGIPDGDVERA